MQFLDLNSSWHVVAKAPSGSHKLQVRGQDSMNALLRPQYAPPLSVQGTHRPRAFFQPSTQGRSSQEEGGGGSAGSAGAGAEAPPQSPHVRGQSLVTWLSLHLEGQRLQAKQSPVNAFHFVTHGASSHVSALLSPAFGVHVPHVLAQAFQAEPSPKLQASCWESVFSAIF